MQQWWFEDGLGMKLVICGVFITFPYFKVFNNIHEYAN